MGSVPRLITATEIAVEVERLKQLISAQVHIGNDDSQYSDAEGLAGSDLQKATQLYGDLEPRTEQTLHYATEDIYHGDTLGNLRHGHGRLSCAAGDVYTGRWRYGKRDGTGHAVFDRHNSTEDGEQPKPVCYDGQWKDDKTHGEGTCTFEDGAVYTGEWNQDQRSGWGRHTFSNKDWYEGEWEADTMEGQGRLTLTDKSYYECSWHLGKPQKGKWYSADGRTEYDGQFKGMLWHGFGTVHQTGVRKYTGKAMCSCSHAASLHCSLSAAKQPLVNGASGSANSSNAAMSYLCNAFDD
ncbi:TPA: hypothetical protein ACH3X2_012760 [Trebouxia sp. C0005]